MLLALDTSTRNIGLALYDGVRVISEATWSSEDYHTVELAPAIALSLERAGVSTDALEVVGVALGPGSFTGLRIGLAVAKGLALARRLALVGIPTLDFLAAAQPLTEMPMAAVLQAGRGRLAVGWYRVEGGFWRSEGDTTTLTASALAEQLKQPTWICGELTEEERQVLARKRKKAVLASPAWSLRRPSYLAELAWRRWKNGQVDDPAGLAPYYLHYKEPIPE